MFPERITTSFLRVESLLLFRDLPLQGLDLRGLPSTFNGDLRGQVCTYTLILGL